MASNKAFVVFALLMLVAASAVVDVASADHGDHDGKKCGPCKCKGCCHYDECYEYCSGDSGPCCKWGKCHSLHKLMASNKAFVVFALLMLVAASAVVDVASADGKCGPCNCKGCCDYDGKCMSYCSGHSGPCCKWKGKCHGCCS
uniref:Uncharacterized protein n=4 Tax=Oryza TaxID=4527 RepID=A0A0E0G8X6_ORYNI